MPDRTAPDVRLGDLRHGDRRLHAGVDTKALERVLERERVEQRREHPRIVGGRAVHPLGGCRHPAIDVPGTHDYGELRPRLLDGHDLLGDRADGLRVDPVLALAEERLAGELQQRAAELRSTCRRRRGSRDFIRRSAHQPATETRANLELGIKQAKAILKLMETWQGLGYNDAVEQVLNG